KPTSEGLEAGVGIVRAASAPPPRVGEPFMIEYILRNSSRTSVSLWMRHFQTNPPDMESRGISLSSPLKNWTEGAPGARPLVPFVSLPIRVFDAPRPVALAPGATGVAFRKTVTFSPRGLNPFFPIGNPECDTSLSGAGDYRVRARFNYAWKDDD